MVKRQQKPQDKQIMIPAPKFDFITVTVIGDTSLLTNAKGESVYAFFRKQFDSEIFKVREKRNVEAEYFGAFFRIPVNGKQPEDQTLDGLEKDWVPGFNLMAAKLSLVKSVIDLGKNVVSQAFLKRNLYFLPDPIGGNRIPIYYDSVEMDTCPDVRQSGIGRAPDIRFRPLFKNWSAEFVVQYDTALLTDDQIYSLVCRAGRLGWGDDRMSQSGGSHGMFHPAEKSELQWHEKRKKTFWKRVDKAGGKRITSRSRS